VSCGFDKLSDVTDAASPLPLYKPPPLPTSMVFIDGTNLDRLCLDHFGSNRIDYRKLLVAIGAGTNVLHTWYVTAPYRREFDDEMYKVQMGTINQLRKLPNVEVDLQQHRTREIRCKLCNRWYNVLKEKGTDVAVASFLVEAAASKAADRMILVANDSDYGPAVKIASKGHNRHCTLAYVFGSTDTDYRIKTSLSPILSFCKSTVKINLPMISDCWLK
jgi:uncharacterized LabA/DUF88 family protein